MEFQGLGRILIIVGAIIIAVGVVFLLGSRIGIGRLPGDIIIKRGNFSLYFPIVTCIIISIILSIIFNLFKR